METLLYLHIKLKRKTRLNKPIFLKQRYETPLKHVTKSLAPIKFSMNMQSTGVQDKRGVWNTKVRNFLKEKSLRQPVARPREKINDVPT